MDPRSQKRDLGHPSIVYRRSELTPPSLLLGVGWGGVGFPFDCFRPIVADAVSYSFTCTDPIRSLTFAM
jgi:hypothetical protein